MRDTHAVTVRDMASFRSTSTGLRSLIFTSPSGPSLYVLNQTSPGIWGASPIDLDSNSQGFLPSASHFSLADLNNDGWEDLVYFFSSSSHMYVCKNQRALGTGVPFLQTYMCDE